MRWILSPDKGRACAPRSPSLFSAGKLQREEGEEWQRGEEKVPTFWSLFFSACFPCLNLSVPVSLTVFITQPPCANKPHMFWFFPYLLSQDKVEMSAARDSL